MRYTDKGEIHKDFHLSTNATCDYVMNRYGSEFLAELARRTAQRVYLDIYQNMKRGSYQALVEHLCYYLDREGGVYTLSKTREGIVIRVTSCPMHEHILNRGKVVSEYLFSFLKEYYTSFGIGTDYQVLFDSYDPTGKYTISIERRDTHAAQ
jgi:hypothetical protein